VYRIVGDVIDGSLKVVEKIDLPLYGL